jgi:TusA-related sulfurtransferase
MNEQSIDCKGLACPLPIVRISQAMKAMELGSVLLVEADDPAFPADIRAWAQMTGNELVSLEEGDVWIARLKRNG